MFPVFPSHQSNELLLQQLSSNPSQQKVIRQNRIVAHDSMDDSSHKKSTRESQSWNLSVSGNNENTSNNHKKKIHRDIEKQRRQEMSTLHASLRSLLPLEYIKVKHLISFSFDFRVHINCWVFT